MLRRSARSAEPAIVRNIYQELRAGKREAADFIRENRFVANVDAEWAVGNISHLIFRTMLKIADEAGQVLGKKEPIPPGHIFAEGDEMNFVVDKILRAARAEEYCAVVRARPAVSERFEVDDAYQKTIARSTRDPLGTRQKISVLQGKWRGNFRPHDDAGNFLGRPDTDLLQLIHVRRMRLHPIGGIAIRDRKIRLHQMRNMIGPGLRHEARTRKSNHDQHCIDADPDDLSGLLALGNLQNYPSRERIVRRDQQGETENAGNHRELDKDRISRRYIPEQIPGKPDGGHVHGRKF